MSKWIEFVDCGTSKSGFTRICDVRPKEHANDTLSGLGHISWYGPWRKYAFRPKQNTVFEPDCLRDIAMWCENHTFLHKEARRLEKANA